MIVKVYFKIKYIVNRFLSKFYTYFVKKQVKVFSGRIQVNHFTILNSNTILGNNVNFNGAKVIGRGRIEIGNNFHSGENLLFITDFHNYNGKTIPYDNTYIVKPIKIKDNVWIGNNVIILGGVVIEEGVIVQAGSVVTKSIPKYAIAGGHPARVFKFRDKNHYESLKKEGKFF